MLKRKTGRIALGFAAALSAGAALATAAEARDLTVVSWGGAYQDAQKKVYFEPFKKASGVAMNDESWDGGVGVLRAKVQGGAATWDVVQVESDELAVGCEEGLFEKMDYTRIGGEAAYIPPSVNPCGVGAILYDFVLGYDKDKLKEAPKGWADFFDTKKIPGKRALRQGPKTTLEIALMADGVAPKDVYKVLGTKAGQDRAFKKLDELKPYIQWWEAGAQPPQFLVAGDVVMSTAYNGRIDAAQKEGKNLKVVWNGSIYDLDYWAIPKGSPNKALAEQYIAYSLTPKPQQAYAQHIAYGPANIAAIKALDAKTLANLPNSPANGKNAVLEDIGFWTDHSDELEQRFAAWATK